MIAQKPMNIFALIDEESVLGSGSDGSLLNKLKSVHGQNEYYRGTECLYWETLDFDPKQKLSWTGLSSPQISSKL